MSKEEIALQLTLKAVERINISHSVENLTENNLNFSNDVAAFYNNLLEKLNVNSK